MHGRGESDFLPYLVCIVVAKVYLCEIGIYEFLELCFKGSPDFMGPLKRQKISAFS